MWPEVHKENLANNKIERTRIVKQDPNLDGVMLAENMNANHAGNMNGADEEPNSKRRAKSGTS